MNDPLKEKMALFRFECIAPLLECQRGEREAILKNIVGKEITAPNNVHHRLARSTLLRWLLLYQQHGIDGLKPKHRKDKGSTKSLCNDVALALLKLKEDNPSWTVETLRYQARRQGIIPAYQNLPRATLYRLLNRHGLVSRNHSTQKPVDRLRFEAAAPMELVQSDCMHGPRIAGKKSYLFALIDDHSRLILWAEFRQSESIDDFIAVLREALKRRGLPRKIYVDNGACFRGLRLAYSLASLEVALIHAKPYTPQGKGKCERWFRTIRTSFLPQLTLDQKDSFEAANTALRNWIDNYYHQRRHSSTGQTPMERFVAGLKVIRRAPEDLDAVFRQRALRKVAKDRAVSLNGKAFEAPPGCIGKKLELRYSPDRPDEVEAFENNKSLGLLKPLMVHSNARVKRVKSEVLDLESTDNKTKVWSGQVPFYRNPSTKGD